MTRLPGGGLISRIGSLSREIHLLSAGPEPVVQATSSGNMLLSFLKLTDSDGGQVDHYRLFLDPSLFNPLHAIYDGVCRFLYMAFLIVGGYSTAGIDWVTDPDKLIKPIGQGYEAAASRVFQVAPPQYLVVITFAALVITIFFHQNTGANRSRLTKSHWNRLASGFSVMMIVLALAANPFKIIQWALSGVSTFAGYMTGTDSSTLYTYVLGNSTDGFLKPLSQLITYHDVLSPECSQQWSKGVNSGIGPSKCLTAAQRAATDPDELTIVLTLLALAVACCFGFFAYMGLKLFFRHLLLTVVHVSSLMYVGVVSLAQRRPYDPLVKEVARASAHGILALVMVLIMSVVPTWVMSVAHSTTWIPLWLQFVILGAGFVAAGKIMERVGDRETSEKLFDVLKGHASNSVWFKALYPENGPKNTVLSTLTDPGMAWMNSQYSEGKKRFSAWWNEPPEARPTNVGSDKSSSAASTTQGESMASAIPNTPQSDAATELVSFPDSPASSASNTAVVVRNQERESADTRGNEDTVNNGDSPIDVDEVWWHHDPNHSSGLAAVTAGGRVTQVALPSGTVTTADGPAFLDDQGQVSVLTSRSGIPYLDHPTGEYHARLLKELRDKLESMSPKELSGSITDTTSSARPFNANMLRDNSGWGALTNKWKETMSEHTGSVRGDESPVDIATSGQQDFTAMALESGRATSSEGSWASKSRYDSLSDIVSPEGKTDEYIDAEFTVSEDILAASGDISSAVHDAHVLTALTGREHKPSEREFSRVFVCSSANGVGDEGVYLSTRTGFGDTVM